MPDIGPTLLPMLLALAAAVLWGTSDFGGGLLGRRAPILGVLIATQAVGGGGALGAALVRGEPMLVGGDLGLTILAGFLGAIGVGSLYGGLAVGRMGVVAPVTAVLTAVTPALIGIALEGAPSPVVILGFGLAIVAVIVVSVVPDDTSDRPSGLLYGLVGGVSLGLLGAVLSRIDLQHVFAPLALMRGLEIAIFVAVVIVGRFSWRLPRSTFPLVLGVGLVDIVGNAAFLTASRIGDLSIAAVLSSLYPVVTVILAAVVLRERITISHAAGVALALVAIAFITGGMA
ncbi:MAG: EamA family transporter [Chloroflexota bacterium]